MAPFGKLAARLTAFASSRKQQRNMDPLLFGTRKLLRLNSHRPSLADLPADIIMQIAEFLQDVSPSSVVKLALVCAYLHPVARYVQHRHCRLDLYKASAYDRLNAISERGLLPALRVLEIYGLRIQEHPALPLLVKLMPEMSGLRVLEWNVAGIPDGFAESLNQLPRARLHFIYSAGVASGEYERWAPPLRSLQHNHNLSSICVKIVYIEVEDIRGITQLLKKVLVSCPNLRKLSLDIGYPSSGCVSYGLTRLYGGLGFLEDECPPALEELELFQYPWGYEPGHSGSLTVNCIGYPGRGTELAYWSDHFDWSRLRFLSEQWIHLGSKIAGKLSSLKEVRFSFSSGQPVVDFLEEVPSSLEGITIAKISSLEVSPLKLHGATLRKLHIHQTECWPGRWSEEAISDDDLSSLREHLPLLEDLTVDVNRDAGDWPYKTLRIISGFSRLTSLTIWFELGLNSPGGELKLPLVTAMSAMQMFDYVRLRSPGQRSGLGRMHIHSGAPPPPGRGLRAVEAMSSSDISTSFVCERSERDDDAARGHYSITCPDLSADQNAKMQRILRGEEQRLDCDEEDLPLKIALDGPVSEAEWTRYREMKIKAEHIRQLGRMQKFKKRFRR